jgi:hypothetical protein
MWRKLLEAGLAVVLGGCATGPLQENPLLYRPEKSVPCENPVYVPQGPMAYARVFEKVYDILQDYWDIAYANRYDGRIETFPRVAPGIGQFWRAGSPDVWQRLLATTQTIRHRGIVVISTADDGGYFIDVKVFKELEDLATPTRTTAGEATFLLRTTVERQFEVVDAGMFERDWIPIGRDHELEQVILERIARFDISIPCR